MAYKGRPKYQKTSKVSSSRGIIIDITDNNWYAEGLGNKRAKLWILMQLLIPVYLGDPQITDPLATESVITTRLWCILMNREVTAEKYEINFGIS